MTRKQWQIVLGEQIKEARELLHISQEELGKRVRKSRGSINSYEKGKGNPEFRVIAEIAAELKADFNVLGCRVAAQEVLKPAPPKPEQLELLYDRNHSFLANVIIRPSKKSITITAQADYGIKTA
jgi:transcriptional regulator with XRE-family HTH domain